MKRSLSLSIKAVGALAVAGLAVLPFARAQDKDKPAEDPKGKPITTVDKYEYMPAESLPPVKGTSAYTLDKANPVVEFPINVWIGWAPIIAANGGTEPNKESVFAKKYGFQVHLSIIDDPIKARDAFAAGKSHILWGTLDMMALFAPELSKDSRTSLRIFQQIDWSNGGDGVVARNGIKTINDLKPAGGKKRKIALAQQSPSHYYLLSLLYYAGIDPNEVELKFTGDAFQAAAAFASDTTIDACVSWSPDIYKLSEMKDCKLISSTKDAKRLIADVWAARADFANDHPEIIEGLVRGILDGMDMIKKDKKSVAKLVEQAYKLKDGEADPMFDDAHATNCAENYEFFLNKNNPTNFEATWSAIGTIYAKAGLIDPRLLPRWNTVADYRLIDAVKDDYKHHKNEYADTVVVKPDFDPSKKEAILTRVVRIHFAPNLSDVDSSYDPNADKIIEEIGRMASQFGESTIVIEGHADRSKYDEAKALGDAYLKRHAEKVRQLSEQRAQGVIAALVKKYPDWKEKAKDKFFAEGKGWTRPLANDALSRRVEIRVLPPEK